MLLLLTLAHAGDLVFSPDRPGIGDSTATVGNGHAMLEGGLLYNPRGGQAIGTSGVIGRVGLADPFELRLRLPDITYQSGVRVGPVGVGGKLAAPLGEAVAFSVVPEVLVAPQGGVSASLGANLSVSAGDLGVWGHATGTTSSVGFGGFVGGGASAAFGRSGVYANAGGDTAGVAIAGGGGWLGLSDAAQLDLGVDALLCPQAISPLFLLGFSVGW